MDQVDEYIKKQKSPQKEILQKLRKLILKTYPGINEEFRLGVPCYGRSGKLTCGKYYIVALKNYVNFGFLTQGMSEEEKKFFEGVGKIMKHIKVRSLKDIDEKRFVKLMKLVEKRV